MSDVFSTEIDHVLLCRLGILLQDHQSVNPLYPIGIRDTDDGSLLDSRMPVKDILHLPGIDVLASRDDHVLLPVRDVNESLLVVVSHIPRMKPSVPNRFLCLIGFTPVFCHDSFALYDDLPNCSRLDVTTGLINDSHMDPDTRLPAGCKHALCLCGFP